MNAESREALQERFRFVAAYQVKARANLAEAQACLAAQQARAAISRAYYALYQMTNAWLLASNLDEGFDADKPNLSHKEVSTRWLALVRELPTSWKVPVDADAATIYATLMNLRVRVDYKLGPDPDAKDAHHALDAAQRALAWLEAAWAQKGARA